MKATIISMSRITACPKHSMLPEHYRDDGTCNCEHREEINEQSKALNIERKRLRAEHKKIVQQLDQLKRTR